MHPELDAMIARMRERGMIASLITNGYYLNPERIERLNRRRPRLPADQHRQRRAGRGLAEEPAAAGAEAPVAGRTRRVRRQHQLRGGERDQEPGGRGGGGAARPRARVHEHDRDPARRPRPAARRSTEPRDEGLRGAEDVRQPGRRAGQRAVPGQPRPRQAQRVELPRGLALPVRRRGRPRALLLADARRARHPARELQPRRPRARVRHEEGLRALLHHQLRAAGGASSTTGARRRSRTRRSPRAPAGARRRGRGPRRSRPPPSRRAARVAARPEGARGAAGPRHRRLQRDRGSVRARAAPPAAVASCSWRAAPTACRRSRRSSGRKRR